MAFGGVFAPWLQIERLHSHPTAAVPDGYRGAEEARRGRGGAAGRGSTAPPHQIWAVSGAVYAACRSYTVCPPTVIAV